jgi:hypothetical protein
MASLYRHTTTGGGNAPAVQTFGSTLLTFLCGRSGTCPVQYPSIPQSLALPMPSLCVSLLCRLPSTTVHCCLTAHCCFTLSLSLSLFDRVASAPPRPLYHDHPSGSVKQPLSASCANLARLPLLAFLPTLHICSSVAFTLRVAGAAALAAC